MNLFFTVSLLFVTVHFYNYTNLILQENIKEELKNKILDLPYEIKNCYIFVIVATVISVAFELNQIYWNKLLDKSYCNLNAYNIRKKNKQMEQEY